jgi:hypothetical protein
VEEMGNIINSHWALGENMKEPCEVHQEHQIPKKSHLPSPPHHLFPNGKKRFRPIWVHVYVTTPQKPWKGFEFTKGITNYNML